MSVRKGISVSWAKNLKTGYFDFSKHLQCGHVVSHSLCDNPKEIILESGFLVERNFETCPCCLELTVYDLLTGKQSKTEL